MILIGNVETFQNAKSQKGRKLWDTIFEEFDSTKSLFNGFPAMCVNHGTKALVKTPEQFSEKLGFDGGCKLICNFILTCLHTCKRNCHPVQNHEKYICKEIIEGKCPLNHVIRFECNLATSPKICGLCDEIQARKIKEQNRLEKRKRDKEAHDAKMILLQMNEDSLRKEMVLQNEEQFDLLATKQKGNSNLLYL